MSHPNFSHFAIMHIILLLKNIFIIIFEFSIENLISGCLNQVQETSAARDMGVWIWNKFSENGKMFPKNVGCWGLAELRNKLSEDMVETIVSEYRSPHSSWGSALVWRKVDGAGTALSWRWCVIMLTWLLYVLGGCAAGGGVRSNGLMFSYFEVL